jgi:DNA-binding NarL/FixJ family response regulator
VVMTGGAVDLPYDWSTALFLKRPEVSGSHSIFRALSRLPVLFFRVNTPVTNVVSSLDATGAMLINSEQRLKQAGPNCRPTRVLLADDHDLVRAGVRVLLDSIPNVTVVGEATSGREVLEILSRETADIVLMDISMPDLNGLDALSQIKEQFPIISVIILSMHKNAEYAARALQLGAAGYLLKRDGMAELQNAIQSVLAGRNWISSGVSKDLCKDTMGAARNMFHRSLDRLSRRQREILQLLAEGETTKGIALILGISNKTVEYHRMQLMKCLEIFDLPGLVRFAVRSGLVALD